MPDDSMDLAIVTCCRDYGRYLEAWARSIASMTMHPSVVAIVDAGSEDDTPDRISEASMILRESGIDVITERVESRNIGTARNAAVELSGDTEWVQHLDCDDEAMSHMVEDFTRIAPEADVICAGYVRFGDLASGPKSRKRVYGRSRGVSTLKSTAPASGVSPFRRSYWKRSPYREDMEGGWDTALWLGFAHQDPPARFIPTKRPVFKYRQHADSVFNSRRVSRRRSLLVGRKLNALRNGYRGVSVLVPFSPDGGRRDMAWSWIRRRYEVVHPEWEIVEGTCDKAWRKGVAVRDAMGRATGDVFVIADADCVVSRESLEEAVSLVRSGGSWVVPHTLVKRLDESSTDEIIGREPGDFEVSGTLHRRAYEGFVGGGMLVIERSKFEAAGGLPTAFRGWGAEDEALGVILDTLIGPHVRLEHDLWHLWHPTGPRAKHPDYRENRAMFRTVRARMGDPDGMWEIVQRLNGDDPLANIGFKTGDDVVMIALMDFQRGTKVIQKGETFSATEREARRFESQRRRVAERLSLGKIQRIREDSESRTLLIRAEQRRRNEEARKIKNMARRRLAMAGMKTKVRDSLGGG